MRIASELSIRKIGNEYLALRTPNTDIVDFSNAFSMNETAYLLLENVKGNEFTEDDLVDILLENYEVTREIAREDIRVIVRELSNSGVIEK